MTSKINMENFPSAIDGGVKIYDETSYENAMAVISHKLHSIKATGKYEDEDRNEILLLLKEFLEYKKGNIEITEEYLNMVAENPLQYSLFQDLFNPLAELK